jgi:flagellar motor switch protein FliG
LLHGIARVTSLPDLTLSSAATGRLTRLQKAAVVHRMLGSLGMPLPPGTLSPEEEAQLAAALGSLGGVEPGELAAVIDEFLAALSPQGTAPSLAAPGFPELPSLPIIEPLVALPGGDGGFGPPDEPDPWDKVLEKDDAVLLAVLRAEAPEVGAIVLSKLKVSRAAQLLGSLPGPFARRITYAVSLVSAVSPRTVERIGAALAEELGRDVPRAFAGGPVEGVGAPLNFSRAATRDDVLEGLGETDPHFAEAVRKSIFTYPNIPARVGVRDVPKILRAVDQKVLVTALAASTVSEEAQKTAEFILGNISQRMAETIRGEMQDLGAVKAADGETAMTAVVSAIRELEEAGEIYLVAEEEGEEEGVPAL